MMHHVVFASCLVLLTASAVISQSSFGDFATDLSQSTFKTGSTNPTLKQTQTTRKCVLPCSTEYVPGTCLCQSGTLFPFMYNSTPCRFATCAEGSVCRMKDGKAECVVISHDKPLVDACNMPADPGPCEDYMPHFFFDKTDGTCKNFVYGGCQGNGNRFTTKSQCESTCIANVPAVVTTQAQTQSTSSVKPVPRVCRLPKESGPCLAYFPSFFFNATSGQCQKFVYGGCRGNENRFESLQACQVACAGSWSGAQPDPDRGQVLSSNSICNMPKLTGHCKAYMPSFFYNTDTGECESFVYGGCGGNANRFATSEQCQQKCKQASPRTTNSACLQPKKIGHCRARIPRWFFNQRSQNCQLFYYGGCGGNSNNFRSMEECKRTCRVSVDDGARCSQPRESGPCLASIQRYFYNTQSGKCETFTYGGCHGNENRFDTLTQCQTTCDSSKQQPHRQQQQKQQQQRSTSSQNVLGTTTRVTGLLDACSQPKVVGSCRAAFRRFYFNKDTGTCERFIYGGCQANQNNFRSFDACMQRCGNKVRAPSI